MRKNRRGFTQEKTMQLAWCLFTGLIAVVCYYNSLCGDMVHDDIFAIKKNPDVIGSKPISDLFLNDFWGRRMSDVRSHKSYRPLTTLTFRWNYAVSGLEPWPFHVVNVLLHGFMTSLVCFCCREVMNLSIAQATLTAVIFAVHPIHTEAVAGIVGRADILAGIFFLLALLCYKRSIDIQWDEPDDFPVTRRPVWLLLSLILAGVAMLSKETGVTVVGVCIACDLIVFSRQGLVRCFNTGTLGKSSISLVKRIVALLVVGIALLVTRFIMNAGQLPTFMTEDNPASFSPRLLTRILTYCHLFVVNALLLLCPVFLSYDWQGGSVPLIEHIMDWRNLSTAVFFICLALFAFKALHHFVQSNSTVPNMIFWSVALTVIPFLPASNLFLRVGFVVAERVLYIPSLGFCICVACGIISIYDGCPRFKSMVIGFTILLLVTFSAKTFQRNKVWSSREALFKSGIVALPHNAKVHYNYANFLKDSSLSDQAIKHYKRTLRLDPYHASAHNNVGTLMKNTTAAEYHYREALRISSRHAGAHVNLGNIYYQQGMLAEGITLLERALEIDPHHIEALFVLGGMMVSAGRWVEAERYLRSAIVEKPDFADAYNNYGAYLDRKGLTEDALVYYQQAYGLNSLHTVAMVNAARGLQELGKIDEAEDVLKRALLVNREVDTLDKLGQFYYQTGRLHEGLALYEEIEEMHPNHTSAMTHYGQLLTLVDEVGKAEIVLLRILNVNPSSIEALRQLSALYGKRGRHEEGLAHIKAALRAYHHQNSTDLRLLSAMLYEEGNHYKDLVRYGEAQSSFAASVSADPDNGLAHMNVGVLYHMNGDLDRAEFHYKKAEFLQNDSPVLKDNLQKLHTAKRKRNQSKNTQPGAR